MCSADLGKKRSELAVIAFHFLPACCEIRWYISLLWEAMVYTSVNDGECRSKASQQGHPEFRGYCGLPVPVGSRALPSHCRPVLNNRCRALLEARPWASSRVRLLRPSLRHLTCRSPLGIRWSLLVGHCPILTFETSVKEAERWSRRREPGGWLKFNSNYIGGKVVVIKTNYLPFCI